MPTNLNYNDKIWKSAENLRDTEKPQDVFRPSGDYNPILETTNDPFANYEFLKQSNPLYEDYFNKAVTPSSPNNTRINLGPFGDLINYGTAAATGIGLLGGSEGGGGGMATGPYVPPAETTQGTTVNSGGLINPNTDYGAPAGPSYPGPSGGTPADNNNSNTNPNTDNNTIFDGLIREGIVPNGTGTDAGTGTGTGTETGTSTSTGTETVADSNNLNINSNTDYGPIFGPVVGGLIGAGAGLIDAGSGNGAEIGTGTGGETPTNNNNNPAGGVGDTTMPEQPNYPQEPAPVDLGAEFDNYINVVGDPTRRNSLLGIEGDYQRGLTNNTYGTAGGSLTGSGQDFNSQLYLRENPDLQAWLNAGGYGDGGTPEQDILRHYNEYGRTEGRTAGFNRDPNSVLGQAETGARAYGAMENEGNTVARGGAIGDLEQFGGRINAANRAANPELAAALQGAMGMGGTSDFFGRTGNAINNAPQYEDVAFQGAGGMRDVNAGQVGEGALGNNLYNQAMGASNLGGVGQQLQARAEQFANSRGQMTADELRDSQQSIRQGYAARGTEMGAGAVTAEALGRLTDQRGRMMQDIEIANALNKSNLAETQQNRNFQQGVQGNDIARQQSNAGLALTGDMSNQGVSAEYGITNQAQQQALNENNRLFASDQDQQNINNQLTYAQNLQGQLGDDRAYAERLAVLQQNASLDPWAALTGITSNSTASGYDIGQQAFENASTQGLRNIDPSAGVNLALTNNVNQGNFRSNRYASDAGLYGAGQVSDATRQAGIISAIGGLADPLVDWLTRDKD